MKNLLEDKIIRYTDKYIYDLFIKCGFDDDTHLYTMSELIVFLNKANIFIYVHSYDNGYMYTVVDKECTDDMNMVSQDLNIYKTPDDALETGVIEGICYLSLKLKV